MHVDGWNNPETPVRYHYPLKNRVSATCSFPVGKDLFLARTDGQTPIVSFVRIPSSPTRGTAEEWTIELPVPSSGFLVCSEVNLLAIILPGTG